jgi:hypothetical protein
LSAFLFFLVVLDENVILGIRYIAGAAVVVPEKYYFSLSVL